MSSLASSSQQPLRLRMRPDLDIQQQTWQGRRYWLIKDPLALKYFRFEEEEYALLSMLDGRASIEDIRERFEEQFSPQKISPAELQQLLANLHRNHLILADAAGQGYELARRHATRQRKSWLATLSNPLAIRFRGIDPDRLLGWLCRWLGWCFSAPAFCCCLALMLAALALITAEFDVFAARLPAFQQFFAPENWLLLAVTMACVKVVHEFGHGLACKRFGGECHEMGLMLLVFTPCLYCNVTDSWMIPSKWRRAAIGAAGIYFELILAAVCTFLWWFSEPGLLHNLCLNVMFVSSVSTVLFNGNPLLRYDGYYILSDLLEIPNLRQKAAAIVQRTVGSWLLGLRPRHDPFLPTRRRWLFAAYAIASPIYGWLVSLSIFWFLYRVLEPQGLKIVGQVLAVMMVFGLIVMPIVRLFFFVAQPARIQQMNKSRGLIAGSIAVLVVAGILFVPLPYYVTCSLELQPRGGTSLYVDVPGQMRAIHVRSGPVTAGQPIVELDNLDVRQAEVRLANERDRLTARAESIQQRAHADDKALLELAQVEQALAAIDAQLAERRDELSRLVIRAPHAGVLVPGPSRTAPKKSDRLTLASWHGRPLDARNLGAYLEASTLVGCIAQPGQLEAILAIPQEEMDYVRPGQRVDFVLNQNPGEVLRGQIEHIAQQEMQTASPRLSSRTGGTLTTMTDENGIERPVSVVYQAAVPLEDASGRLAVGGIGQARIHAGYQPLAARLWRSACRTFRFDL